MTFKEASAYIASLSAFDARLVEAQNAYDERIEQLEAVYEPQSSVSMREYVRSLARRDIAEEQLRQIHDWLMAHDGISYERVEDTATATIRVLNALEAAGVKP